MIISYTIIIKYKIIKKKKIKIKDKEIKFTCFSSYGKIIFLSMMISIEWNAIIIIYYKSIELNERWLIIWIAKNC